MSRARFNEYVTSLPRLMLPKDEQLVLIRKAQAGNKEARERLAQSVLRLVPSRIKKTGLYFRRNLEGHLMDLVLAGNKGIVHAIEGYKFGKGKNKESVRFGTYAAIRINAEVLREAARISLHQGRGDSTTWRIQAEVFEFIAECGRKPQAGEECDRIADRASVSVSEVVAYLKNPVQQTVSLNEDRYDDEGETLLDATPDLRAHVELERYTAEPILAREVEGILEAALPDIEHQILIALYGLGGTEVYSHNEVASMLGIRVGRVCEIESKALRRLRGSGASIALLDLHDPDPCR